MGVVLGLTFEVGQATTLMAILMDKSNKPKYMQWVLMAVLTIVQILGNIFSSYKYILTNSVEDLKYFKEPIFVWTDLPDNVTTVIVTYIIGAILPVVCLLMTSMLEGFLSEPDEKKPEPLIEPEIKEEVKEFISPKPKEEIKEPEPQEEVKQEEEPKPIVEEKPEPKEEPKLEESKPIELPDIPVVLDENDEEPEPQNFIDEVKVEDEPDLVEEETKSEYSEADPEDEVEYDPKPEHPEKESHFVNLNN
jgi:hypothetical protein